MKKKLLKTYLIVISLTISISVLITWTIVKNEFEEQIKDESVTEIILLHNLFDTLESYDEETIKDFVNYYSEQTSARLTIVLKDGLVVADSNYDAAMMDNHRYREEIIKALETNDVSESYRHSRTTDAKYYYLAVSVENENFSGIIRTATRLDQINKLVNELFTLVVVGIIIGSIFAFGIAIFLARGIVRPIKELTDASKEITAGNYNEKIYVDQEDEIGQLARTFNDMTFKLRTTMLALENKNAEIESVLKGMNHGIIVIDPDLRITIKNKRFLELFHINEQDIEGRLFFEVTRNVAVFDVFEKVREDKKVYHKEAKFSFENDERLYLLSANPVQSIQTPDVILGTLLVVQDITEIRRLENIRTDFVSNVTHELKTPLTSIKGFVDTLKTGAIEDKKVAFRFLDIIHIESERLELLINDILTLSEIENLGTDNNLYPEDISNILYETIEILAGKANEKDLELRVEVEDGIKLFKCNKDRIKQIFINLISNAIKYTEEGYIKVILRENYGFLSIIIEDSGIGIDNSHIPRLFERFYRVDKGRSRKQGGTGLGLSIVKHIVELYNGRISVESEVNVGTKITVTLPYKDK